MCAQVVHHQGDFLRILVVLCQNSAGRYFGAMSVNERCPKMGLCGDRSPVAVSELTTERRIDGFFSSLIFRWDDPGAFPELIIMAECNNGG